MQAVSLHVVDIQVQVHRNLCDTCVPERVTEGESA